MKIDLKPRITVQGYSQLHGIDHTRIKARSKKQDRNSHYSISDALRKRYGSYTSEYRLVKEEEGYIFREVLQDSGINGHHKTMKAAIVRALVHVTIHVDEGFEHESHPAFQGLKKFHTARSNGCKHKSAFMRSRFNRIYCPECGIFPERLNNTK